MFVGHPLADEIPLSVDSAEARRALELDPLTPVVALLPGSRIGEVSRLAAPFAAAAARIAARKPGWQFLAPMASAAAREAFVREIAQVPDVPVIRLLEGQAQRALAAAEGAIVASGTATLETLLTGRPMVVAYKVSAPTAFLLRTLSLVKVPYFSQPNLLAGRRLVPEFFQERVQGAVLGDALLEELEDSNHVRELRDAFSDIHCSLRRGGAALAAEAILACAGRGAAPAIPAERAAGG